MKISIIAALGKNNVIGRDNKMIWHLPDDLEFFKNKTSGHHLLMGKNTYLSLKKQLKGRKIIVLSRDREFIAKECQVVNNIDKAINLAEYNQESELFIGGGQQIYQQFLNISNKMYLTHVDCELDGDRFFPEFNPDIWKILKREKFNKDDRHEYSFEIIEYERIVKVIK
jgi:dihydrofolate reductase